MALIWTLAPPEIFAMGRTLHSYGYASTVYQCLADYLNTQQGINGPIGLPGPKGNLGQLVSEVSP